MEGIVETVTMFEGSILSATFDTSSLFADVFFFGGRFFAVFLLETRKGNQLKKLFSEGLKNAL